MKLDVNALRYLSREDFRVLTAVEMGQKNHEIVPVDLITAIAGLKHGGTYRHLTTLLRFKLLHHDANKYDGYRLTYMGYDFLAIRTLLARGHISAVGRRIGVGKESDVFEVRNEEGEVMALKLHRLGRTSFRAVKNKRDYLKSRDSKSFSWLYLSRLAALKEYAFMAALEQRGLPVPRAVDHNRHAVLMSLIDAYPLTQVRELANPGEVYTKLMDFMERLASLGLIHCDFNEFNVLVNDEDEVTIIDFPQMVSVSHPNARELFQRDVEGVYRFFTKKLAYIPEHDETLQRVRPDFEAIMAMVQKKEKGLDTELAASGFKERHQQALESWQEQAAAAAGLSDVEEEEGSEAGDNGSKYDSEGSSGTHAKTVTEQAAVSGAESQPESDAEQPESVASEPLDADEREAEGEGAANLASAAAREGGVAVGVGGRQDPETATAAETAAGVRLEGQASGSDSSRDGGGSSLDEDGFDDGATIETGMTGATSQRRRRRKQQTLQDIQRRVTAARQGAARRNVMSSASRNAQKRVSNKRRADVASSAALG